MASKNKRLKRRQCGAKQGHAEEHMALAAARDKLKVFNEQTDRDSKV